MRLRSPRLKKESNAALLRGLAPVGAKPGQSGAAGPWADKALRGVRRRPPRRMGDAIRRWTYFSQPGGTFGSEAFFFSQESAQLELSILAKLALLQVRMAQQEVGSHRRRTS